MHFYLTESYSICLYALIMIQSHLAIQNTIVNIDDPDDIILIFFFYYKKVKKNRNELVDLTKRTKFAVH